MIYSTTITYLSAELTYGDPVVVSYMMTDPRNYMGLIKTTLIFEGTIILIFGILLLSHVQPIFRRATNLSEIKKGENPTRKQEKVEDRVVKPIRGLHVAIIIIVILVVLAILAGLFLGRIGSTPNSALPHIQTTSPTFFQTPFPTFTQTSSTNQRCSIIGKWTQLTYQGSPVSGVYIQLYSDNRIELYLNNQLHYWGTWEVITPDKYRYNWYGGQTATDTVTLSPDCKTMTAISGRGEISTLAR
jgi:hypothetical protein